MSRQRYKVTIVSPGENGEQPVLLVPFEPSAIVTAFVEEIWKRLRRQGIPLEPNTHIATLHLDGETGALIDVEDVLSDVVTNPARENIFAVFTTKENPATSSALSNQMTLPARVNGSLSDDDTIAIRVVTPESAKDRRSCPILHVPIKSTIKHLHDQISEKLQLQSRLEGDADALECNCKLANLLANGPCPPTEFRVIHGKSLVESLPLPVVEESGVKEALRVRFGVDVEARKRVALIGSEPDEYDSTVFKKPPVVSICSRHRHTPAHARVDIDESGKRHY